MTLIHKVINIVIHILMHTWIKLHTAIIDHEIMRDSTALQIFIYLLGSADDKGYGIFTKRKSAKFLCLNTSTFYKGILRCAKKYDLVTLMVTARFTKYSILNWDKYQSIGNRTGNRSVTAREPLSIKRYIDETKIENKKEKEKKELSPIVSGDKTLSGFEGGSLPQGSLPTTPSGARNLPPNSAHPPSSKKLVTIYNANSEPIQYEEVGKNLYKHLKTGSVNVGSFWSSVL